MGVGVNVTLGVGVTVGVWLGVSVGVKLGVVEGRAATAAGGHSRWRYLRARRKAQSSQRYPPKFGELVHGKYSKICAFASLRYI